MRSIQLNEVDPETGARGLVQIWSETDLETRASSLFQGRMRLDFFSENPPTPLVAYLSARLSGAEVFGPSLTGLKVTKQIAEAVIQNGIRQSVVLGDPIDWMNGPGELRQRAFVALTGLPNAETRVFVDLCAIRDQIANGSIGRIFSHEPIPSGDRKSARIVLSKSRGLRRASTSRYEHIVATEINFEFFEAWDAFQKRVRSEVLIGIREMQIIGVEQTSGGSRLMTPLEALAAFETGKGQDGYVAFAFANSFISIIGKSALRQMRVTAAVAILQRIYNSPHGQRKLRRCDGVQALVATRAALSTAEGEDAWKIAHLETWKRAGTSSGQVVISLNEIKSLIIGG